MCIIAFTEQELNERKQTPNMSGIKQEQAQSAGIKPPSAFGTCSICGANLASDGKGGYYCPVCDPTEVPPEPES